MINELSYDEFEVGRDKVRLCQVLGEGEFGVVHKALLLCHNDTTMHVAVKTLKSNKFGGN